MSDQEPEDQTEYELERTRKVVAASMAEQIAANEKAAAVESVPDEAVDPWDGWTVEELKDALADNDLKVSGNRDDLIARLNEAGVKPGEA